METGSVINVVGVHCRPDQEEKLNRWYNERHIPDLLKFKGVKKATRYTLLTPDEAHAGSPDIKYPMYLAVYEFESQEAYEAFETSPERAEAMKELNETWAEDKYELVWRVQYKALGAWEQ